MTAYSERFHHAYQPSATGRLLPPVHRPKGMIQIKRHRADRPPKMAHGIKTGFHHRGSRVRHGIPQHRCAGRRPVFRGAGLAPRFLALPAHRVALRVLRLEPHLRRPRAIGRASTRFCLKTVGRVASAPARAGSPFLDVHPPHKPGQQPDRNHELVSLRLQLLDTLQPFSRERSIRAWGRAHC